jgi:hypothetical protein
MNPVQLPFLVEGFLILIAMTFGILLSRKGKPYGKVKLVVHLFFFVWFAIGFGFILHGLSKGSVMNVTWIPVSLMGLTIMTQFVSGIVMIASRKAGKLLQKIHLASALLLLASDVSAFFITGLRP